MHNENEIDKENESKECYMKCFRDTNKLLLKMAIKVAIRLHHTKIVPAAPAYCMKLYNCKQRKETFPLYLSLFFFSFKNVSRIWSNSFLRWPKFPLIHTIILNCCCCCRCCWFSWRGLSHAWEKPPQLKNRNKLFYKYTFVRVRCAPNFSRIFPGILVYCALTNHSI